MTPNRPGEASLEPDWGAMQAKWAAWHAGPPEILYHYTTAQGLLGMLSSNRLWATNARFLNDPTEIEYAANIVRQLLSTATQEYDRKVAEMESGKNILERFSNKLFLSPAIKTWSADILKVMDEQEHVYIVCFCVEGDLLSQWRGYGATGSGYAVGFRSAAIQHEPGDPAFPRVLLRKVIYKKDDQSAIVREWLDGVYGAELAWRRKHDDKLQVFKKTGSTSWQNFLETF